ncbi:CYTH and CHAD domain-containing protein [Cellulomonas carbonis]|uniref:Metal-binding protein n=1 Tax=Cellulomonas carbonis T26 TaxID=947969 RepID=A0A0A0BL37_9CELL|nr:CYTH and CHAD domain-containing protein [Cellulomonas carbonis]KGM09218.1 metal-binding protein [Cellulomonas carbonis T26]GGC07872.1 CHAD domain-containing protein [Cellulomonas carbonis]
MASSQVEHEIKLDVPAGAEVPDLRSLPGVAEVRPETVELEAQYMDTADLSLLRARTTLRRRTGGPDEGWHLKRPVSADGTRRTELHAPLGSSTTVPAALRRQVQVVVRGRPIVPVATLSTTRTYHRLVADDGRVLAEVCDDVVRGRVGDAVRRGDDAAAPDDDAWREWEVELVDGEPDLLDAAGELLTRAGAEPAGRASKVGRVLSGVLPDAPPEPSSGLGRKRAGTVVWEHLAAQVAALQANDPLVRTDEPDAVHDMRVATRRLRSALRTFRPLVDRDVTDPLRDELKRLGQVLGEARDAEVLRGRLRSTVDDLDAELVVGPVAARVGEELDGAYRTAHRAAVRVLDAKRYLRLLDDLDRLVADPPWTGRARDRADDVLPRRVRSAHRDVVRAVDRAASTAGGSRDVALHEVRKAAKRARYAAEAVATRFGEPAERYAAAMEAVQDALGEHQDAVVARRVLRDLGMRAHLAGENGFTWGLLHGLEQARADAAESAFAEAWAVASRKKLRRWFD